MAELILEDQELYDLAKSYLKNCKNTRKPARLYIRKNYRELKVSYGDPFQTSSSPNRSDKHDSIKPTIILKTGKLEEDFEDVADFYWKPDRKDNITRKQLHIRLEYLRENITRYAEERFYYCDHTYEVEEDGRKYVQCEWCDKVQYPVLQKEVDGETKSILTDTPDEVMEEDSSWNDNDRWMSKYRFLTNTSQLRNVNPEGMEISEEVE
jgi:hypothetical protein